jgi:hypothetical protein
MTRLDFSSIVDVRSVCAPTMMPTSMSPASTIGSTMFSAPVRGCSVAFATVVDDTRSTRSSASIRSRSTPVARVRAATMASRAPS